MKLSKAVDEAIRDTYAVMARVAAKRAVFHVGQDDIYAADSSAEAMDFWLKKAGARATRWRFVVPQL